MKKGIVSVVSTITLMLFLGGCSDFVVSSQDVDTADATEERSVWSTGTTFTHDPSIIYADGLYWMFYTADGIGVKYSTDGKKWNDGVQIFSKAPSWWSKYVPSKTDFNIWAPDISYYNGKYNLYYSVSTFGSNTSCIGLMQCTSILKGDWVDMGVVISSTSGSKYNCIDPNFVYDGTTPYLVFGSWFDGIWITRLSSSTMKPNQSPIQIADRDLSANAIEGACIWNRGNGYFYLFASYDKCCNGTNSTYNIRYGRASKITGPYYDQSGKSMLDGGGTILKQSSGNMIGPGGQCIFTDANGKTSMGFHYYNKANNGVANLCIQDIKTVNGWPVLY